MGLVRSVNVGRPRPAGWTSLGRTSIDKAPVVGPVEVGRLGLDGDAVANRRHHGGPDKAVYAFAREDLDHWSEVLGVPLRDGQFGENLTTTGLEVNEAELGERWRIGDVVLEVAGVRTPCQVFRAWMGRNGLEETGWLRRFTAAARPGPYLRVVVPGRLQAGDAVEVVQRPGHGVSVSTLFRAVHGDAALLPGLLAAGPHLPEEARVRAVAAARGATGP